MVQLVSATDAWFNFTAQDSRRALGTPNLLRHLELIAVAKSPLEVVEAIRNYLAAWPKERIRSVQTIDRDWAPFDDQQMPSQVNGTTDLRCVGDAVHRQG